MIPHTTAGVDLNVGISPAASVHHTLALENTTNNVPIYLRAQDALRAMGLSVTGTKPVLLERLAAAAAAKAELPDSDGEKQSII
jgi:hypothetical protein